MPERNLVTNLRTKYLIVLTMVLATLVSMQMGCTKLRQSTFGRDLLNTESVDSASRYMTDPYAGLKTKTQKQDSARFVGLNEEAKDKVADLSSVRLVAAPVVAPAPSLQQASEGVASTEEDCDHDAACDCHKPKMEAKLPFAEPIDPPAFNPTPPSALVSQPLAPILFNADTRQPAVEPIEPVDNSLRRNDRWSHEKGVEVAAKSNFEQPRMMADSPTVSSDLTNSNPIQVSRLDIERNQSLRNHDWSDLEQTDTATQRVAASVCRSCNGVDCDGSCQRRTLRDLQPVVKSEPVVIVATTTNATVPPFAEPPVQEFLPDPIEIEQPVMVEQVSAEMDVQTELVGEATPEVEEFTEAELIEMFAGVNPSTKCPSDCTAACCSVACTNCGSGECNDAKCGMVVDPEMNNNFSPLTTLEAVQPVAANVETGQPASVELEVVQPVAVNLESDNSFPVEAVNEFVPTTPANENSDWGQAWQPGVEVELEIEATLPANSNDFAQVTTQPIEVAKQPVELEQKFIPQRRPEPRFYSGPAVRFEIIDNTVPWNEKLTETIQNVESRLAVESEPQNRNGLEVNLRLLEVLQRQMTGVEQRKDSFTDQEKQVWQHQLDAITLMLNSGQATGESGLVGHDTAADTLSHLRKAIERLEAMADLQVTNGALCTEISGFGQFRTFANNDFSTTQRMLVYCEVENYASEEREFNSQVEVQTRLRGSYAIYDQQGSVVQQAEYPVLEDVARKRRRDFYLHFPVQLENLPPGRYKLDLFVEDLNGNKSAALKPAMEFRVR